MNIRKAIASDIDNIYTLGSTVDKFSVSDEVVTFWPKHILHNIINSRTDLLLIAEEKDEVIGLIIVNNSFVFKKAIVENIYVSSLFRGQGVAKKLLDTAMDIVLGLGCEYVCALMNDEKAINFYESNGFKKGRSFTWLDKIISKEFSK
jgi:ribosomal protein S18 acetylase RimI-like enzyme